MYHYFYVASDLIKTLVSAHPLPWEVLTIGTTRKIIATTTKAVILNTTDPAVAAQVMAMANTPKSAQHRDIQSYHGVASQ